MSDNSFTTQRRLFLRNAALASGALFLGGCVRRIPLGTLPPPNVGVPLTIDVHCHIFNGTDLPIREFLKGVEDAEGNRPLIGALSGILQDINWGKAPTGFTEITKLRDDFDPHLKDHLQANREKLKKVKAASYKTFRKEALAASKKTQARLSVTGGGSAPPSVPALLPANYDEYRRKIDAPLTLTPVRAQSSVASERPVHPHGLEKGGPTQLFDEYFQYRYVALNDYLDLYNGSSGRSVDLMIAHMVDYDWALSNGCPTLTPLHDQVTLMKRICLFSNGRVHGFAPFDPLREVVHNMGNPNAKVSSLDFVKHSILTSGCLGVKMYPPMGFAPLGNADIDPATWNGVWDWLADPKNVRSRNDSLKLTFGQRLDQVLRELYSWCLQEDIPVMAHTNISNGRSQTLDELTEAKYWKRLQDEFGGLRLNFGHLGGFPDELTSTCQITPPLAGKRGNGRALVNLMARDPNSKGGRFFGDAAFESRVLNCEPQLEVIYRSALLADPSESHSILRERLMYGSDWSLLIQEPKMAEYLEDFVTLFQKIDSTANSTVASTNFFGANAVNYLGLAKGNRTRDRIEKFYSDNGMPITAGKPVWMQKVDAMPA